MKENRVRWLGPVGVGLGIVIACGSSDSKKPRKDPDPSGGEAGDVATGGTPSGGTSGKGGVGGTGGSGGKGGSGGAGEAGDGPTGGVGAAGSGGDSSGASGEGGSGGEGGTPPPDTVTFTIEASRDVHPISPRIYGANRGPLSCNGAGARFGACRLGSSQWSTYNWEIGASNAGAGRCHENNAELGATTTPAGNVLALLSEAGTANATAVVTIPMLDYVAADKTSGTAPPACSGDVRTSTNPLQTRFKASRARKGSALSTTPDTTDAYVNQDEFVNVVATSAGSTPVVFALDNQPELWRFTHPVVHPAASTYDEVVAKTVEYATMVRDVAPAAEITSYVGYGFNGFVNLQDAPDRAGKGEFIDYFLAQMATAGTNAGRRLIDYLDVHWYPELYVGSDRIILDESSPEFVAKRVQAPRSLWDATYVEDGWIPGALGGGAVRLIPRLKEKIATNYAGTKLAISEWNYGGGSHVSGAIAAADALGIFGREGVELAAYQSLGPADPFVLGAFGAYRNYDGQGAAFGDRSVHAASSDDALASVYASIQSTDAARMVIVAINRSGSTVNAAIDVEHTTAYATADVYRITSSSATPQAASAITATAANAFLYEMPAFSVSVLVPRT